MSIPSPETILVLALLLLTLLSVLIAALRARSGRLPAVRPFPAIDRLRTRLSDVAESGLPVHIATGSGESGAPNPSAETLASLTLAQRIAEAATQRGGTVAATSGDAVSHLALRGTFHNAFRQAGFASEYQPSSVQLVAHTTPVGYAAGVAARTHADPPIASVIAGRYGGESLLISEEGAAQHIPQIAAATTTSALPVLTLSADQTLVGEELFAAEAYLSDTASSRARLVSHDWLRWLIVALLIGGLIWQILALFVASLGLPVLM